MIGRILGHYEVIERLGEGGMGVVYKARDTHLDRLVAIKMLAAEKISDPDRQIRFVQEAKAASALNHPNIITIHDIANDNGTYFIVMEYVRGTTLDQLSFGRGLGLREVLKYGVQIADGLAKAHAAGIIHRDLKPGNIMVTEDGIVKVLDFGLAKLMEPETQSEGGGGETLTIHQMAVTEAGVALGTAAYMSPEQAEGKRLDARTDVFSFGCVLYEMVTGKRAFQRDSKLSTLAAVLRDEPPGMSTIARNVPPELERILARCLNKDPQERFPMMADVKLALEELRQTSESRGFTVRPAEREKPGRKRLLAASAAVVVLLAAAIFGAIRWLNHPAKQLPGSGEEKYLAVIPFKVLGDQSTLGYVAEGLAEALSAKLFRVHDLHVASSEAIARSREKNSGTAIARDVGATLAVSGTVQGTGEKLRVTARLEDVPAGRLLWSGEVSGASRDLLEIEDKVYEELAAALPRKPGQVRQVQPAPRPTQSMEAYDLYLKGRNAIRSQHSVPSIETAIRFYEESLKKDPGFALAYASLSEASLVRYQQTLDRFWVDKAEAAAQEAPRLNNNLAEVHSALGNVYLATGKTEDAVVELRRAVELSPNVDEGYRRLGRAYAAKGQNQEAFQAYQKAVEIDPYYWYNYNELGTRYFEIGEYEHALSAFRRVAELEPANALGYQNIGAVYYSQRKFNECIPAFQKAIDLSPDASNYSNLATVYLSLKRCDEAVKLYEKAVQMSPADQRIMGNLADAYRCQGRLDKAGANYDKAITLAYKTLQVNPKSADTMGNLARYYSARGNTKEAIGFIRRARAIDPSDVRLIYVNAVVQARAGRVAEALEALKEAFAKGYSAEEAESDADLEVLHERGEFKELVRKFAPGRK